jgi:lysine 2,3-aminomutase
MNKLKLKTSDDFSAAQWSDWKWQMANSIRKLNSLKEWINVTEEEDCAIQNTEKKYKWRITPYYAALMDKDDPCCPVRLQAVPHLDEMIEDITTEVDPVGDMFYRKTNRVIHKYPNRIVLLVTEMCPVYCRHCTRKFHTAAHDGSYFESGEGLNYEKDFQYIADHPEIKDVLLTGGDPLSYSDTKIEYILNELRQIRHVEVIRFGSRFPVFLPQRITDQFCDMLAKYQPIWFSTHFNHSKEITIEAIAACDKLLARGIPVQNQTVLLKGINDDIKTMRELMSNLIKNRIRPYYIYHCDQVTGVAHFKTSIAKGREIMQNLWGHISGFSVPRYIITTKIGKISLEDAQFHSVPGGILLKNYQGEEIFLPENYPE